VTKAVLFELLLTVDKDTIFHQKLCAVLALDFVCLCMGARVVRLTLVGINTLTCYVVLLPIMESRL